MGILSQCPKKQRREGVKKAKVTRKQRYGNLNTGWNEKAIETRLKNGNLVPIEKRSEYNIYKLAVVRFTMYWVRNHPNLIKNIKKRDNHATNSKAYHIDHKFSMFDGFKNNTPAYIIGHWSNLHCIPYKENLKKQKKSSIIIDQLFENFFNAEI